MRLRYDYVGNHTFNCNLQLRNVNANDDSTVESESFNTDSASECSSDLNDNETVLTTGASKGVSGWPSHRNLRFIVQQHTPTNLHNACRTGCYATVERLLLRGADANASDNELDHGVTPLHVALIHDHDSIVQLLLDLGATVNHAANNGWTPLHIAASNGRPRTVQTLLDHKADMLSKEARGWTPIFVAAFRGHFDVVQLLLAHYQQSQQQQQQTRNQSTSCITFPHCTSNHNSNNITIHINAQDVYGQTLLMIACQRGHVKIVKLLLRHGARVHVRDEDGATALQLASRECREIIELSRLAQETYHDNSNSSSCISACRIAKSVKDDPQKLQFRPCLGDRVVTAEQRRDLNLEHDPLCKIESKRHSHVEKINL